MVDVYDILRDILIHFAGTPEIHENGKVVYWSTKHQTAVQMVDRKITETYSVPSVLVDYLSLSDLEWEPEITYVKHYDFKLRRARDGVIKGFSGDNVWLRVWSEERLAAKAGLSRFLVARCSGEAPDEYRIPFVDLDTQLRLEEFLREAGVRIKPYDPPWKWMFGFRPSTKRLTEKDAYLFGF